jgi:nitrate reductase gamma subunit
MTELVASGIPYRDTFWNIPMWARVFVYVGGTAAIVVFAWGCWQRVSLWLKGKPERRTDRLPERIVLVLTQALGQARTLSQAYPGVMHAIVFWGFLALFIGTVLATIDYDITLPLLHVKLLKGTFYLLYELVLDMFGLFFVVGLGMACWRRFVARPSRVDPTPKFAYALLILFVINATGFVMLEYSMTAKYLGLLKDIAPFVTRVAVLRDAAISAGTGQFGAIQSAAPSLRMDVTPVNVRDAGEIERAIATFAQASNGGLIATASALTVVHRDLIIRLAARYKLPAVFHRRLFVAFGGLMSYGVDIIDQFRQAAGYVDRILKGEKPANLPVQAPTRYELAINLKTAKALGLDVPPMLLARADEVIE